MSAKKYFTAEQKQQIIEAIEKAELNTSGEIRVHIDSKCKKDVLHKAAQVFTTLKMHKTALRNGVLLYISVNDHKFAIVGDSGINGKVPEDFWESTKEAMLKKFKENDITGGLIEGIAMAGEQLKKFFPYEHDDKNELDNEISFS